MNRRVVAVGSAAVLIAAASAAYGASITFTTPHLGATSLAVPPFYPDSLVTQNVRSLHQIANGDTLTVVYSKEMDASTLCTGAPTQTGTLATAATFTVSIDNNAGTTGNDVLTVNSVPTSDCSDGQLRFGSIDLGSAGYVTKNSTFTRSSASLTQTATSATLVITLNGRSGSFATVASGAAAVYIPDTALTDTAGHSIGESTAVTSATVQF